jgi:hypothetical protein
MRGRQKTHSIVLVKSVPCLNRGSNSQQEGGDCTGETHLEIVVRERRRKTV